MSNAAEYATEDARLLHGSLQSAEELVRELETLKASVDNVADGTHNISEDAYERIFNSVSIKGINQRLDAMASLISECASALRKHQL